jgi:hypothetical protein
LRDQLLNTTMQLMAQAATTPEALAALRYKLDELEAASVSPLLAVAASGQIIQMPQQKPKKIILTGTEVFKRLAKKKKLSKGDLIQAVNIFRKHLPPSMIFHFAKNDMI